MWRVFLEGEGQSLVSSDDLEPVETGPTDALAAGNLGDGLSYLARLGSALVRHAYRFDPRSGLSNARIEPALHQIYVAHRVVHKTQPRMILADEVGLGKTIEAGLIAKELTARGLVDRTLIVVPASLQLQWQAELRSKFNEEFTILDGPSLRLLGQGGDNPWLKRDKVITSLQLVSREQYHDQIVEAPWDLAIFDEAHRVRRWLSGSDVTTTRAYELAERLRDEVFGLLLLSATPMQLHQFELFSLIELIEPGLFVDYDEFDRNRGTIRALNEVIRDLRTWEALPAARRDQLGSSLERLLADDAAPVELDHPDGRRHAEELLADKHPWADALVRNRKVEVGGFTERRAHTRVVPLTPAEEELYDDIARYAREGYRRARNERNRSHGFLMVTYHQMLASSSNALYKAFERRIEKLRGHLEAAEAATTPDGDIDLEVLASGEDSDRLELLQEVALDPAGAMLEIEELTALRERLAHISDSKANAFMRLADELLADGGKLLVFTRFLQTQEYLRGTLEAEGYEVALFNGKLDRDQKEREVKRFRDKAQVMVTTEAGGEGRNFQFCHRMVNYDLPWNPMKVEQRIGRLDRMGQKHDVHVYTLATEGTVEERILHVLHERIRVFEESVGSLDPILGGLEDRITEIVLEADDQDAAFAELGEETEQDVRKARATAGLLEDFAMDLRSLRRDEANRLLGTPPMAGPDELVATIDTVLQLRGGQLVPDEDLGGHRVLLSAKLRAALREPTSTHGTFYPSEALRNEDWEFFTVDHPLIAKLLASVDELTTPVTGVRFAPGLPVEPSIEVFWSLTWDSPKEIHFAPWGRLLHHIVARDGTVTESTLDQLPTLGEPDVDDVPGWAAAAIGASTARAQQSYEDLRTQATVDLEEARKRRLDRLEGIHRSRKGKLERRVTDWQRRIEEMEATGSDDQRKIIPVWRGNIDRLTEQQRTLDAEHDHERRQLEELVFNLSLRPIAAGVVIGDGA